MVLTLQYALFAQDRSVHVRKFSPLPGFDPWHTFLKRNLQIKELPAFFFEVTFLS